MSILDETIEFTDHQDYCRKKNISTRKLMNEINNLERIKVDDINPKEEYPEFINRILESVTISESGKKDFMERFGINYLNSNLIRRLTDKWHFYFVNNEYIGVYHSMAYGDFILKTNYSTCRTAEVVDMYIKIHHVSDLWFIDYN